MIAKVFDHLIVGNGVRVYVFALDIQLELVSNCVRLYWDN